MFCSLALVAVLLNARVAPVDTDAEFRDLIRLPYWTLGYGANWSTSGKFRVTGDTPLARQALAAVQKEFEKHPNDVDAHVKLYGLLTRIGDRAGASRTIRKLIVLYKAKVAKSPNDWKAHDALAWALMKVDDLRGAEAAARRAVALAPEESDAWLSLAMLLKSTRWNEAMRAVDKAVALAGDDDLDTRLTQTFMRIQYRQWQLDQLPRGADPVLQGARVAQLRQSLLGVDKLITESAQRLKAADGTCGPDTRDRCLVLLGIRDTVRAKLSALLAASQNTDEMPIIVSARTAKLIQEIVPPTSDDPARLFAAAYMLRLAPANVRSAADPYLHRLDELAQGKSTARAATAAFQRGIMFLMMENPRAAVTCFRRAVRLEPTFDLAWVALLESEYEVNRSHAAARSALLSSVSAADLSGGKLAVAREWAAKSGSVYARYMLAATQAAVGDWPAADRTVTAALDKYPNDPRLMISRGVCCLRLTTTKEDLEVAQLEAARAYSRLNEPGIATRGMWREYVRLAILCCARSGQLQHGLQGVDQYAQQARSRGEKADAAALRRLFDHLATSPLKPLRWPDASYPLSYYGKQPDEAAAKNKSSRSPAGAKQPGKTTGPAGVYSGTGSAALFGDAKQPSKPAPKDHR